MSDVTRTTDPVRQSTRILEIRHLKKYFPIEKGFLRRVTGHVKAVDDVSLTLDQGETLGLVGESGCGKTTLGRYAIRAIEPTDGTVLFDDGERMVDFTGLEPKALREMRRHMQMIFQDPYGSLDPRMTVLDIVGEPLKLSGMARGQEVEDRVLELMEVVGLQTKHLKRYPHAFSGGQRQRIGIARALATNPRLVVCDEAVSALDVSIQAQILNLLHDLQQEFGLTYLFVAHNLSVVEHIADRVAVMYVGRIVELSETEELFRAPLHPYTEALLSAVPSPDLDRKMNRILLTGEVANPANVPSGCPFHPRCRYAKDRCSAEIPEWKEVQPGHYAACHFAGELTLEGVQ
jgi:peptide/nickel transport system ATP-binding protein